MLTQHHPRRKRYVEASTVQGEAMRIGPNKDPLGGCGEEGTETTQSNPDALPPEGVHVNAMQGRKVQSVRACGGGIQVVDAKNSFRFPGNNKTGPSGPEA